MNSDRWKQIETLYNSALEVEASDRGNFLAVACAGDDDLRQEVLSLLSSAECNDSFLGEPALSLGLTLMGNNFESLAGKMIGRYKLLELLGRGGMGEVYLALDHRLNRRIALKLLPAGIDIDPDRVRRFEQEARAASAISHPNVAHIYEIGEEQGRRYITMEYVRGQTLRQALMQGSLEVCKAIDVAIQIALALAAAHEAGVVHRDIKPENIMLSTDGYVRVLDFGLAKLVENRLYSSDPEALPLPSLHTEPELLMGTSDYISPEQVRRQPVEKLTDLWSLGVVLYEMLAGHRPFRGREPSEVIVAILEREPEPISDVRPGLPLALQEVVSKALLKTPEDRYQSAQIIEAELRRVRRIVEENGPAPKSEANDGNSSRSQPLGLPESGFPSTERQRATTNEVSRPYGRLGRMADFKPGSLISTRVTLFTWRWRPVHWFIMLSLIGGGLYFGFVRQRQRALQNKDINLRFERLNLSGGISDITLSPDGKYVASVVAEEGKRTIHITELATASDLRIAPPSEEGYSGLSFSPDGTYVYYIENHAETGTLYRVSKLGGGQRKILNNVNTAVTFSPDGTRMAFVRYNNMLDTPDLVVAQADGTSERLLARRTRADAAAFMSDMKGPGPLWSPDGKVLACPTFSFSHDLEMNVEVVDIEGGTGHRLNAKPWYDISRVAWLADGSGLVVAATESPGAPWQLQLLAYPSGEVRKVTNDPNNYTLISGARDSSLLLSLNTEEDSSVWQVSMAGGAQPAILAFSQRKGLAEIEWERAGGFLYTVNDGVHANLWAQDVGAPARQLTYEADNRKPTESSDGRHIVFVSTRAGAMNIWRMNSDGTQPTQLTKGAYEDLPSVTPDGRWVIYRTGNTISKVDIDGGNPIKLLDKSALCPALSPNGQLLAFFTNDQPDSQVWHIEVYDLSTLALVKRFELPKSTTPFTNLRLTPDNRLRWTPDAQGLTYVSHADGASNIWLQPLGGDMPRQLTFFKDAEISSFAWSRGGNQLACVRNIKAYVPVLIRLF
jgi:serine/threonine protein kinase/Tol biopolymer transport system component